ncbi:MAG: hypothetical protein R3183_12865 [Oleiphilaceae bacterium]|nr:hypothetical protein [Oleiphilaceae bacterium]
MCTQKEKRAISHFNRIMIGIAGIAGLLMDGFQGGDSLCTLSMLFWLWQSECNVVEEKLLDQFKRLKTRNATSH